MPLLEDLLSQLDLAIKDGRPLSNAYDLPHLRQLREDLVYAFSVVLRENLGMESQTGSMSDKGQKCMALMKEFLDRLDGSQDCIISLNYDLIADNAIYSKNNRHVDYGFSVRYDQKDGEQPERPFSLPLYKLHGSLNWLYCPTCQQIDVANDYKGVYYIFEGCEDQECMCRDCGTKYEPLIIAPTLLKTYENTLLRLIWREAEDKISKADEVVFVGYSMSDADVQLRCMFKRALYGNRIR